MNRRVAGRVSIALAACLLSHCGGAAPPGVQASPSARRTPAVIEPDLGSFEGGAPGENADLAAFVVRGKTTLYEFYSPRCEHSQKMAPVMEYLAAHRGDLAIRLVDIDRPEATEVDFDSPIAEQYEVSATPSFRIYDAEGALVASGSAAKDLVRQWYQDAQLGERAEQLPGVTERYRSPD